MSDHHVYKKLEMVGSSKNSIEEAIQHAISQVGKSVDNLEWFEVVDTRGHIVNNKVAHFQVTVKLGFKIRDS